MSSHQPNSTWGCFISVSEVLTCFAGWLKRLSNLRIFHMRINMPVSQKKKFRTCFRVLFQFYLASEQPIGVCAVTSYRMRGLSAAQLRQCADGNRSQWYVPVRLRRLLLVSRRKSIRRRSYRHVGCLLGLRLGVAGLRHFMCT